MLPGCEKYQPLSWVSLRESPFEVCFPHLYIGLEARPLFCKETLLKFLGLHHFMERKSVWYRRDRESCMCQVYWESIASKSLSFMYLGTKGDRGRQKLYINKHWFCYPYLPPQNPPLPLQSTSIFRQLFMFESFELAEALEINAFISMPSASLSRLHMDTLKS